MSDLIYILSLCHKIRTHLNNEIDFILIGMKLKKIYKINEFINGSFSLLQIKINLRCLSILVKY